MTTPDDQPAGPDVTLDVDGADLLMAKLQDARNALDALGQAFHQAACAGHHPDPAGNAQRLGEQLFERYSLDALEGDWLLGQCADVRTEMQRVLLNPRCLGHDDDSDDDEGDET